MDSIFCKPEADEQSHVVPEHSACHEVQDCAKRAGGRSNMAFIPRDRRVKLKADLSPFWNLIAPQAEVKHDARLESEGH